MPDSFIRMPSTAGGSVTLPASYQTPSRRFRDAWLYDADNDVVTLDVEKAKAAVKAEVDRERDVRSMAVKAFTLSGGENVKVQIGDRTFRENLDTLYGFAESNDRRGNAPGLTLRDAEDTEFSLPPGKMIELGDQAFSYGSQLFNAAGSKRAEVDALATADDVKTYDLTTGWPS